MEVVKPVKEVKQPKRSAASSKSDTVVTLGSNQDKSELQAKRNLRKKRQGDHQSEIYNMKNVWRSSAVHFPRKALSQETKESQIQRAPKGTCHQY